MMSDIQILINNDGSPQWRYPWISVKERLPDNDQYVITFIPFSVKYIRVNWYMKNKNRWHEGDDGITHWMELPSPPENE